MITLESNIAFLIKLNIWRRDIKDRNNMPMPSPEEIGLHIDFAVSELIAIRNKAVKDE